MLMTDASIIMRKTVEVSGITKEGVEIPIEISLTSQKINGREYLTTSIIRNLTERKKMEKELAKIQKFEFLELLANGIAHDFNNSLAGIMGNISLAKMDTRKSTIANERLIEAEKAILRTKNLVLQLLTFKKNGTPIKQAASIKEIIRESIVLCLRGSKTTGECSLPYNLWPVEIDVGQIGQVINNLIINASQAMPEGGNIKVFAENITLDTEDITDLKIGPYIKITVQDQGTGIPGDKIQSIFDPFFTTKKKGGGLGLTVCRSVIRKHDGHIDVKSEVGSGTSFTVYIPATQEAIDENREKRENGLKGFGKILVSDEDEQIRSTTSALLMCIGYKVDVAVDDEDAVTLYKEAMESAAPFDAVILDLSISNGMGGKKTIKEILKLDPDVKAIISSGCSNDRVMSHYREYGFSGALTKPFEIHDLNVILRNLIVC
ncbi:MAG: response regulator [Planctomycetes bacterium]|nr:response regulator [Planctomycetota bacterium]